MNAQHTPGLLSLDGLEINAFVDGHQSTVAECFNHSAIGRLNAAQDARRLVACWNACQRLDTKLLENISRPGSQGIHPAPQERIDDLLETLKAVRPYLLAGEALIADAAIAKATAA